MLKFSSVKLILGKDVDRGDQESLQTLFHSVERYRPMVVMANAEEGTNIRVTLQGLGTTDLKLGDDMERGQIKTIMTLFWFEERARLIEIKRKAKAGKRVTISMIIAPERSRPAKTEPAH
jgi:hypothetical protein